MNGGRGRAVSTVIVLIVLVLIAFTAIYTIDTGHVGVEKTLGKVDLEEVSPGVHLRMPLLTTVWEFSAKEIPLDLNDLTPKAADNLSVRDLDVTVFYRTSSNQVADILTKYASVEARGDDAWLPGYGLIYREARGVIYDQISKVDSLVLHRQREGLQSQIHDDLQERLDSRDQGSFQISRVVIRALNTDPSIEESIRLAVQNQKKLEAKKYEVDIAVKDAEITIQRAKGLAEANRIINASLTAEYLQHEVNQALMSFAEHGGSSVVIPANMQGFSLILDRNTLRKEKGAQTP
jgi:regulator of protease activity HflC (stomatin/prohibitin superfamily)